MIKDEGLYYCEACDSEVWIQSQADLVRCPDCLEWACYAVVV